METCALDKNLRKQRERTNFLYVIEAALEYFITMLFTGAYLATLTKELGEIGRASCRERVYDHV